MLGPSVWERLARLATLGAAALILGLLAYAAAGPLATDDVWWHLSLGRLYAELGPWLADDGRLHTAVGPPDPNAWLFDWSLARIDAALGLNALRPTHVGAVGIVVALVWTWLRRHAIDRVGAELGVSVFVALSSYRLLQLRPSLATLAATLALAVVLARGEALRARGVLLLGAICALWANLHPGFVLGPLLLAAATFGEGAHVLFVARRRGPDAPDLRRTRELAVATVLATLASGLNPTGFAAHLDYVFAGLDAVDASVVVDEWVGVDLFALPRMNLPPTPLAWACLWAVECAGLVAVGQALRDQLRLVGDEGGDDSDAARKRTLIVLAMAGLVAPLVAVRFLWMAIFPLTLVLCRLGPSRRAGPGRSIALTMIAVALATGYVKASDWTLLAPRRSARALDEAHDAKRYYGHAVRFLHETGVEGNLFNLYFMGGFLEYWLGPRLKTFVDGSLNFPPRTMERYAEILSMSPRPPHATLDELLADQDIDLFVGVGLPMSPPPGRPWRYTTTHLERSPAWIPVFRSLRSAVYLRRTAGNEANLDRIAAYYRSVGAPFDRASGLDVSSTLREATDWAIEHGVAPVDIEALREDAETPGNDADRARLASTYAVLGLYAEALEIDGANGLPSSRGAVDLAALRRRLWCLLRLDRTGEADSLARAVAEARISDPGTRQLARRARRHAGELDRERRNRLAALATPLSRREATAIQRMQATPRLDAISAAGRPPSVDARRPRRGSPSGPARTSK